MITIIFIILGAAYDQLLQYPKVFFVVYGATFFFSNFGPNTTTYVLPLLSSASLTRSGTLCPARPSPPPSAPPATASRLLPASSAPSSYTPHSSLTVLIFQGVGVFPFLKPLGVNVVFFACAGIAFLGLIFTLLFVPETKGISLRATDLGANPRRNLLSWY